MGKEQGHICREAPKPGPCSWEAGLSFRSVTSWGPTQKWDWGLIKSGKSASHETQDCQRKRWARAHYFWALVPLPSITLNSFFCFNQGKVSHPGGQK